ncbi:uncharacterized protein V1518DRAFT_415239 [Limtongia smithiae]|uniref:uncharacterized protein n=1 Tax=Limtongia smithiae TaxID=1125753 RepID=UPI0034CF04BC
MSSRIVMLRAAGPRPMLMRSRFGAGASPAVAGRAMSSATATRGVAAAFGSASSRALFRLATPYATMRNATRQLFGRRDMWAKGKWSVRFNSSTAPKTAAPPKPEKVETGLKALTKKYGWPIVWVYLGLSALDYPVCFFIVHSLGQEKIGEYEAKAKDALKPVTSAIRDVLVGFGILKPSPTEPEPLPQEASGEPVVHKASLWTEAVIAYGIHKSLLVFRIPLAAAITPSIVKFCQTRFPRLFASKTPKFGVKPDASRRIGGGLL